MSIRTVGAVGKNFITILMSLEYTGYLFTCKTVFKKFYERYYAYYTTAGNLCRLCLRNNPLVIFVRHKKGAGRFKAPTEPKAKERTAKITE